MAENQRGWRQPTYDDQFDQFREEQRRRDEDQHRYPSSENRYNSPGYGSGEMSGSSSRYVGSSNSGHPDHGREQYGSGQGSWEHEQPGNRGWGTAPGRGWGSPGYGGGGYSAGYGSRQHYGTGIGSAGSWGGSSGAMGGTEYGTGGAFRRSSYGTGYVGRYQGQPHWQEQQQGYGDRGFWDKTKDEVSSWFGDEEAERRRVFDRRMLDMEVSRRGMDDYGQARDVRTTYSTSQRGKGPKAYRRSDDRIREDISDRLSDDDRVDASEIEVGVYDAEVTLSGTVDSRESKRRAEDIAEMVSGVQHVQNNLRVNRDAASGSRRITQEMTSSADRPLPRSGLSETTGGPKPLSTADMHGTVPLGTGTSAGLPSTSKSSSGTSGKTK